MNPSASPEKAASAASSHMAAYRTGDKETRPWGHYIVTGVGFNPRGEEYCEKIIVIKPWQVLSLQSHDLRREKWTVKKGTLTTIVDGERIDVLSRESIEIPVGSIHCMANLDEDDCIVEELQEGICREEDIKRYMDAYHRATEALSSPVASGSVAAYHTLLSDIKTSYTNRTQSVPH